MSVSTSYSAVDYNGASAGVPLAVAFPVSAIGDIYMAILLVGGTDFINLVPDVDFTRQDAGGGNYTVTPVLSYTSGITVRVYRFIDYTQPFEFNETGPLDPGTIESALDRLTMCLQDTRTELGALIGPVAPPPGNTLILPVQVFASSSARAAATPQYLGQPGVQYDDGTMWYGSSLAAGGWAALSSSGTGDVSGPGTVTDARVALWDGNSGTEIKDGQGNDPGNEVGLDLGVLNGTNSRPFRISQIWNNASGAFEGLVLDITNSASASGAVPFRVRMNGSDILNLSKAGVLSLGAALSVASGGTGQTTYSAGQLLIGKTDGTLAKATLTAGADISITPGDGSVTISATGTVQVFASSSARAAATPQYLGQPGVQYDDGTMWYGSSLAAGGWTPIYGGGGTDPAKLRIELVMADLPSTSGTTLLQDRDLTDAQDNSASIDWSYTPPESYPNLSGGALTGSIQDFPPTLFADATTGPGPLNFDLVLDIAEGADTWASGGLYYVVASIGFGGVQQIQVQFFTLDTTTLALQVYAYELANPFSGTTVTSTAITLNTRSLLTVRVKNLTGIGFDLDILQGASVVGSGSVPFTLGAVTRVNGPGGGGSSGLANLVIALYGIKLSSTL